MMTEEAFEICDPDDISKWSDVKFDDLKPGDVIRKKREPDAEWSVESFPEDFMDTREIKVKAL